MERARHARQEALMLEAGEEPAVGETRSQQAARVFEAWRARQARPASCTLTREREEMIVKRLRDGYTVEDLLLLLRWVYEADEPGPRWLRGENPERRTYLDLVNLLRREKMGGRVDAARTWEAADVDEPGSLEDGLDLGPMRFVQGRGSPVAGAQDSSAETVPASSVQRRSLRRSR